MVDIFQPRRHQVVNNVDHDRIRCRPNDDSVSIDTEAVAKTDVGNEYYRTPHSGGSALATRRSLNLCFAQAKVSIIGDLTLYVDIPEADAFVDVL